MPIFEFRCEECTTEYEQLLYRSDDVAECPDCGSERAEKLLSGFAVTGDARKAAGGCGSCSKSSGGCSGCSCH